MSLKSAAAAAGMKIGWLMEPTGNNDLGPYGDMFAREASAGWMTFKHADCFTDRNTCDLDLSSYGQKWSGLARDNDLDILGGYLAPVAQSTRLAQWFLDDATSIAGFEDAVRRSCELLAPQLAEHDYVKRYLGFNEVFVGYPEHENDIFRPSLIVDLYGPNHTDIANALAWIIKTMRARLPSNVRVGFNDFGFDHWAAANMRWKWSAVYDVVRRCEGACQVLGIQGHIHQGLVGNENRPGKIDELATEDLVVLLALEGCELHVTENDYYTTQPEVAAVDVELYLRQCHGSGVKAFQFWNPTNRFTWLHDTFSPNAKGNVWDQSASGAPLVETPMYHAALTTLNDLAGDTMPLPDDVAQWMENVNRRLDALEAGGGTDQAAQIAELQQTIEAMKSGALQMGNAGPGALSSLFRSLADRSPPVVRRAADAAERMAAHGPPVMMDAHVPGVTGQDPNNTSRYD